MKKWYGLFDCGDPNAPVLIAYARDKTELRQRAQAEPDRAWLIDDLAYDPTMRCQIVPVFAPDTGACVRALELLQGLSGTPKKGQS